jgi:hypothetical protein
MSISQINNLLRNSSLYTFGYFKLDTTTETKIYYDNTSLDQTGTNARIRTKAIDANRHFRRSNRHANYLLNLFCKKFNSIRPDSVLVLTDLKSDKNPSTSEIKSKAKGYKFCLAKYYSVFHANVILFELNSNGDVAEKLCIEDKDGWYNEDTSFNEEEWRVEYMDVFIDDVLNRVYLIYPGFYIAHKTKYTKPYKHGELTPTSDYHIPSALLFGGFMRSILIVILIIVIIVCVVIYIHDRKYMKTQQQTLDKK